MKYATGQSVLRGKVILRLAEGLSKTSPDIADLAELPVVAMSGQRVEKGGRQFAPLFLRLQYDEFMVNNIMSMTFLHFVIPSCLSLATSYPASSSFFRHHARPFLEKSRNPDHHSLQHEVRVLFR